MTEKHPGRTATTLWHLSRLPRTAVFLGTLILALAAFFTPGAIGAALVGLLAIGAAVLTAYTWNDRTPAERALRLVVFGLLVAIAVSKSW